MGLQLHNPNPQQPHVCRLSKLGGDHHLANGALSSKVTLNLFKQSPPRLEFFCPALAFKRKKWLKGDKREEMSKRNNSRSGTRKLDLRLNLAIPRRENGSPSRSATLSPPSSCVSSDGGECHSPEGGAPMVLVGCPRCLMYVMLSENDPRCPKCKSTVLLDFLSNDTYKYNNNNNDNNNNNNNDNSRNEVISKKTRRGF